MTKKLLNALYAQRKRLAESRISRPFMVFSDATLRKMVEKKPLSTDELLNISGVGEKKCPLRQCLPCASSRMPWAVESKTKEKRPVFHTFRSEVENRTLFSVMFIFP